MQIKKIREKAELTQTEFAYAINATQKTVALWESGRRRPQPAHAAKIREVFGDSIAEVEQDEMLTEFTSSLSTALNADLLRQNFELKRTIKNLRSELIKLRQSDDKLSFTQQEVDFIENDCRQFIKYLPYMDIVEKLEKMPLETLNQAREAVGLSSLTKKIKPEQLYKRSSRLEEILANARNSEKSSYRDA